MLRPILLAIAVILAGASVSPADAGIPIPCTGTRFIKAPDLPSATDLRGQKIALYYMQSGCSGGQWDGYKSADGTYHKLSPGLRASLPEAPGFWPSAWQHKARFWAEWLWLILAAFVVVGTLLSKFADAAGPDPARPPTTPLSTRQR